MTVVQAKGSFSAAGGGNDSLASFAATKQMAQFFDVGTDDLGESQGELRIGV